ncbi:MAG: DUF7948 domain-containing protein [Candidatus Binataceae bacterium]
MFERRILGKLFLAVALLGGAAFLSIAGTVQWWRGQTQGSAILKKSTNHTGISEAYGRLPLSFEPNVGQTARGIDYLSRSRGFTVYVTPTSATFDVARGTGRASEPRTFRIRFDQADAHALRTLDQPLPGVVNYYIGDDPAKWYSRIPTFGRVGYRDAWPGIDVVYHGTRGQFEFDLVASPGANLSRAELGLTGIRRVELDRGGNAILHLTAGSSLVLHKPDAWQDYDGTRHPVEVSYRLKSGTRLAFAIGAHDDKRALVIDPSVVMSTFVGGHVAQSNAIAVDANGWTYLTGWANDNCASCTSDSGLFPTTAGPAPAFTSSNTGDAWVEVLTPTGTAVEYATLIGGGGFDEGTALAPDGSGSGVLPGNVYVVGNTQSTNFPFTTPRPGLEFGNGDAWIAKFDPTGAKKFATEIGGNQNDVANGVAIQPGCASTALSPCTPVIVGATFSNNFDSSSTGTLLGSEDAFLVAISSDGGVSASRLEGASTPANAAAYATSVAIDGSGAIYVTGGTNAATFPTVNLSTDFGGTADAFVMKLSPPAPTFSAPTWSRFLGGSGFDEGLGIALIPGCQSNCTVFVEGNTFSPDFPDTTSASFQGMGDTFVTEISADGATNLYSTMLGGLPDKTLGATNGIAVDSSGDAFVVGTTSARNLPVVTGGRKFQSANGIVFESSNNFSTYNFANFPPSAGSVIKFQGAIPTIYAATERGQIFSSTDGNINWSQAAAAGLPSGPITSFVVDPNFSSPLMLAATGSGLYISTDGAGATFSAAGINDQLVTWTADMSTSSNPQLSSTTVLAGVVGGIEISTDGGTSFDPSCAVKGFPENNSIIVYDWVLESSTGVAYFATNQGVWASTSNVKGNACGFTVAQTGLSTVAALSIQADQKSTTVYAGTFENGLYVSTDGVDFSSLDLGFFAPTVSVLENAQPNASPNTILAGVTSFSEGSILVCTDGGISFSSAAGGVLNVKGAVSAIGADDAATNLDEDAFVAEVPASGGAPQVLEYLGGDNYDTGSGIAVNSAGDLIFVTGSTFSGDGTFPISDGAVQSEFGDSASGGFVNGFVTQISQPAGPPPSATPSNTPTSGTSTATPTAAQSSSPTLGATPSATATTTSTPTAVLSPTPTAVPTAVSARLTASPKSLNFPGGIVLGNKGASSQAVNVTLGNPGRSKQDQPITILAISASPPFAAGKACVGNTIQPGGSCQVSVTFTPSSAGVAPDGSLVVTSNARDPSITVRLKGRARTGSIAIAPKSLNFGRVALGQSSAAMTVTLTNENPLAMTLSAPSLSDSRHEFAIGAANCTSTLAANGGTCSISVRFDPTVKGAAKAQLQINDDAAGSPQHVNLAGSGG